MTWRDEPGLGLQGLPHVGVKAAFGHIPKDGDLLIVVSLPQDSPLTLLDLGRLPRGIEVMESDESPLNVRPGAHLLRASR